MTPQPLEQIWSDYRGALRGFLLKRVGDADDVDDLLQDILIRTHRHLPELRDRDRLRPWLFAIARNAVTDFYRASGRGADLIADDLWYGADEETALSEMESCLRPFLKGLDPAQAALLEAIDLGGIAQKAYAQDHGIAYSTLKSRVASARADLRRLFDRCCSSRIDARGNVMEFTQKGDGCGPC